MIDSLLLKQLNKIKILWIPSNNVKFENLFSELNYDMFNIEHLFLGHCCPNLVITNNRFSYIDDIVNICNKYSIIHYYSSTIFYCIFFIH